nr:putative capsid protein [Cressdnaviricota sp.]
MVYPRSPRTPKNKPPPLVIRRPSTVSKRSASISSIDPILGLASALSSGSPLSPYIRGAQYAKRAYDMIAKSTQTKNAKFKKNNKYNNTSTGVYVGRFKKAKKVKKTFESRALSTGFGFSLETHGRVNDPNTCFIGHSTTHIGVISETLLGCILRKLFTKAGFVISNRNSPINANLNEQGEGFEIEIFARAPDDAVKQTSSIFISSSGSTLDNIATGWSGALNMFNDFLVYTTQNEPYRIMLYTVIPTQIRRLAAEILITDAVFELKCQSILTIQNRSAGSSAGAGVLDADRVDNQPVKATQYNFTQATPRLRSNVETNNIDELSSMSQNGILLRRAAEITDISFQDAPVAQIWTNCNKKSYTVLNPGHIRKSTIVHMHKGKLYTLMKRIRPFKATNGRMNGGAGKSQLYHLEEKLRTDDTNPITLQYERDFECYCLMTKAKVPPIAKRLFVNTQNNTV